MTRTVIRIGEHVNDAGDTRVVLRPEEPTDVKDFDASRDLGCQPDDTPFAELAKVSPGFKGVLPNPLVRQVGERLFHGLSVHSGVLEAIDRASRTSVNAV